MHIDPATGRNKRETGKFIKMREAGRGAGEIRKLNDGTGRPAEKRIDQKRQQRTGRG